MKPEAQQKMTEMKTAMLLHVPFFASLMLDQMKVVCGKFPDKFPPGNETAATDGKTIWIDEDFIAKLTLPEAVFLMCHEIGHAMWQHMSRAKAYEASGFDGKPFNHKKWNYATDYVINDMLKAAGIGDMPEGGLHDPQFDHATHMGDDVYRKIPDPPENDGNGSGAGLDQHIPAADNGSSQAEWKRAIQSAADRAKAQGNMPDNLARIVQELVDPKVPWQEMLRTIIMRSASREAHTWARPHRRRLVTQGVVLPSYTGFGAGEIVIGVDTSGSISDRELKVFMTEMQSILDVARPERIWVVPCDAQVHEVSELAPEDDLRVNQPPLGGGGGTAFEPVFEWVEEQGIEPSALVYLTDMYGSFPREAPPYKTIWCSTTDREGPFGDTVHIEISDYD